MDGYGSVSWWGFSPALDLRRLWARAVSTDDDLSALNVLVVGGGDLRHVLTTLASTSRPVKFFISESCLEVYARHLLFLQLLSEPFDQLGPQEKCELFLELFGNSLLRAQTAEYLRESSVRLIRLITDLDHQKVTLPILDLSFLKFKERDFMEGIFKFWKNADSFPVEHLWDGRLRNYLGNRYDSRKGVYDWDYFMKLQEMAPLINCQQYKEWRETGVAFKCREDAPYEVPNKTLSSAILLQEGGDSVAKRGYWGDVICSPYLSFGIQTDNKELLKVEGGKQTRSSVQVSEHSVSAFISQLGGEHKRKEQELGPLQTSSMTFLPLPLKEMPRKACFRNFFHVAYFSNSMVHHLAGDMASTFSEQCLLVCESANFMVDLQKEKKEEFAMKVGRMAESLKFKACEMKDIQHHLVFTS